MQNMSTDEWREFVSAGTRTGKAAVVLADGSPHVTPIWLALDGDDVLFTTEGRSVKRRALARDPRVSICVDEEKPPFSYVQIMGEATLTEDLGELRKWATVLGGRYMGADRAAEYGARNGSAGEFLVRVRPTRVIAYRNIAD
jgi:PPOX class probable F420-dependent enzyme